MDGGNFEQLSSKPQTPAEERIMATGSESRGTVKTKTGFRTPSKSAAAQRRENMESAKKFFSNRRNLTGAAQRMSNQTIRERVGW
jgi:hypothetical protein